MTAKAKPAPVEVETDSPLEDYLYEVGILAEFVLSLKGSSRDRDLIRLTVRKHLTGQTAFKKLPQNRLDVVIRGLCIGVTKTLEAWEYVALNRAWPPENDD